MDNLSHIWSLSDLKTVKKNKLKVMSLFSGAGGSSMGYKLAGLDVVCCVEIDEKQLDLYKKNLNPEKYYLGDIRDFLKDPMAKSFYDIDILDASPPCTLFSNINKTADKYKGVERKFKEGQKKQTLDDLFFETIKLVKIIMPKVCIFENVMGLLQKKNKKYVDKIINQLNDIGYSVAVEGLCAMDFGVPQIRKRVFFIALRNDINCKQRDLVGTPIFEFKKYKHVKWGEIEESDGYRPLTKYMLDLWLKRKPTDRTFQCIMIRQGKLNSLFGTTLLKKNNVAPTITARNSHVLYDQPRSMNDTELIKCASFPFDYDFANTSPVYSIGMCVPPLMMARMVNDLMKQIQLEAV